jgi:hypothetical protein
LGKAELTKLEGIVSATVQSIRQQSVSTLAECRLFFNSAVAFHYSCLNVVIGSVFAARRAGIQHAIIETTASNNGTPAKVSGSAALTPYSRFFITRDIASGTGKPIATPIAVSFKPSRKTILSTSPDCAPSAIRRPISRARRLTE